jgi:integrase
VWSAREGKRIRKHFDRIGEAKTWREDAAGAIRQGRMRAPTSTTVDQAADALIAGMRDGSILDRSGAPYKPSTVRSYDTSLRLRIRPEIGRRKLSSLERRDVQALVERWRKDGLQPSTVQNQLNPLQVLCRRAIEAGELAVDPTSRLRLPAIRGRRERIANPNEAAALIEALPAFERAIWATAMYAGLRHGELRALRWGDIDFDGGVLHVRRSWDPIEGPVDVKSKAGRRSVPMLAALRKVLAAHKLATGRGGDALVFGRTAELAFTPSAIYKHARKAWEAREMAGIDLHESRHTFASWMIAAGLNIKQISVYMGHADIKTTLNIYGHLLADDAERAAERLDEYLADSQARAAKG